MRSRSKFALGKYRFSFPTKARVVLKDGDSRSGTVIDINSQDITIKKGQSIVKEAIANIARIEFKGDFWWPTSGGLVKRSFDDFSGSG